MKHLARITSLVLITILFLSAFSASFAYSVSRKSKSHRHKSHHSINYYQKPKGYLAQARCNERGGVVGGRKGDQNGEISLSHYVSSSRGCYGWDFVIRASDPKVANKAARFIIRVCKNDRIGYNNYKNRQGGINKRDSLYKAAKKVNWNPSKIRKRVDTSCTPMCLIAFNSAGVDMSCKLRARYVCSSTGTYTGTYKARTVNAEALEKAIRLVNKKYKKKGKEAPFKIIKMSSGQFSNYRKYLRRGDVVCSGHHTAMVL